MSYYLVILLVIAAGAVLAAFLRSRASDSATAGLKRRYRQLVSLSAEQADNALRHQMKAVRKKYPGRSEQWYLEKIIYDLERDRR